MTAPTELPVVPASKDTLDHAVTVLAQAFMDDPMLVTTLRDPVRRAAGLPLLFRAMAHQVRGKGLVDTDPEGRGVALWTRPDAGLVTPAEWVQHGYLTFGIAAGLRDAIRLSRVQDLITPHHHELLPEPHGYLYALGVAPAFQGQGVGSGLLARGCRRLDDLGLPGYLETNLPQNVRLYERYGFETRRVLPATPRKQFETWCMVRPAPVRG